MRKPESPKEAAPAVRFFDIDNEYVGQRVDNFLMRVCKGVPKSHLYKAIRSGEVRVNKGRVGADYRLCEGDLLRVPPLRLPTPGERSKAPPAAFPVVFEDDAMVVINKPAGVAVHGGSGVSFGVIEQMRSSRPDARFLELAHRLDRETSGLLMIAKRRSALVALHQMLRDGQGQKQYKALVVGDWVNDRQHIKKPLLKWLTAGGERRVRVDALGKPAHTIVTGERRFGAYTLVDAELRTGRTHQIRVHLASSGFPIVGDEKYGLDDERKKFAKLGFNRMFLHAWRLAIPHPLTGEALELHAELPTECRKIIEFLEKNA